VGIPLASANRLIRSWQFLIPPYRTCRSTPERWCKSGGLVTITLEPDTEKREIEVPIPLRRALGAKLTQKLNALSFTHKKEFVVWYSEAKKEDTRARRVEKMKQMLSAGKVIS